MLFQNAVGGFLGQMICQLVGQTSSTLILVLVVNMEFKYEEFI
jgi:hypothetical protein